MTTDEQLQNLINELGELRKKYENFPKRTRNNTYCNQQEFHTILKGIKEIAGQTQKILEENPNDFEAEIPTFTQIFNSVFSGTEWLMLALRSSLKDKPKQ